MDQAEVVPPPEVVNAEKLETKGMDDPFGPPQVSCAAWAIVDRDSGDMVAGDKENERMHIASTTKIMTAYLVLSYAAKQPDVLNEVLTFSKRADDTNGSTAGVKAGEQLTVGELMYGLMLPSGNDASVAFAEHFGRKFAGDASLDDAASYDRFIAQMNSTAAELGHEANALCKSTWTDQRRTLVDGDGPFATRAGCAKCPSLPRLRDLSTTRLRSHSTRWLQTKSEMGKHKPIARDRRLRGNQNGYH